MCGFVGFTGEIENKEVVLENMMNTIVHRGPDSAGIYTDEDIALGFRRLSIIDLEHGSQPLHNEDKSVWLIFNGEIYNFQALREELIAKGHIFTTHTDSEVLIHGYEEYKEDIVNKLRGMFAFVIWDIKEKSLFCARDHFGIKPFYYATMGDCLMFGSEIKSFLPHPSFKKELNEDALKPYLTFQYPVTDYTFFKNVNRLPAAHYLTFKNGKLDIVRYWDINFEPEDKGLDYYVDEIEKAVKESVEFHRISDVKVGSFLSSGVDSSYITSCLMPNKTFTVGFNRERFSEIDSAQALSKILNIESVSKMVTAEECFENFSKIQYHCDEPESNPSTIPLFFLAKLAREHVTVILSGEGADEIFGGYPLYRTPFSVQKYQRIIPKFIRKPLGLLATKLPDMHGKKFLLKGGAPVEKHFVGQAYIFDEKDAKKLLNPKFRNGPSVDDLIQPIYDRVKDKDDVTKMQYLDFHLWMPKDILLKADKMSMASSIELRVPFLDKEVVELARKIPSKYRVNNINTKYVFRQAANRMLPDEWASRKKIGFPVPVTYWLREEKYYNIVKASFLSEQAKQFFDTNTLVKMLDAHYSEKKNYGRKLWTIYTFLVWYNKFFIELN
ncbi:MAG: asnB [Clostridiales bacterium]|jgi:asparagine synthase (glutamine-hydrolysing)|nr:asnB [Clostridiales bacterium]